MPSLQQSYELYSSSSNRTPILIKSQARKFIINPKNLKMNVIPHIGIANAHIKINIKASTNSIFSLLLLILVILLNVILPYLPYIFKPFV